MNQRILLINSGGTFDSVAYADPRNPPHIIETLKGRDSLVMPAIRQLPHHEYVDGFSWGEWQEKRFSKDSKEFTDNDITALAELIQHDTHRYFILTHGTDAMTNNAAKLQEALKDSGKTVAFVGAIVPLSMHTSDHPSDGIDALRYTLEHIEGLAAGVYITGRNVQTKRVEFFNPETTEKDRSASLENLQFTVRSR